MTLSLDLVNKCSLSSSCVPSARITHNPGTQGDQNEAGRQKLNSNSVKSAITREGESAIYRPWAGGKGWEDGIIFSWAGQEGFTKEAA